ncbi:hypothetical protein [Saccharibacillus sp. JS10]|uniref:hypothetical protein n=1 Tax=Saccharibacillus sp. JS10 TaxID=2950552 RepID=UPI00210BC46C|nr:hypothetical protein [Saccharibacillus sp. JS10]MCQ4087546.1 hypothetical protein [Saccharibacillus sp. JS10]
MFTILLQAENYEVIEELSSIEGDEEYLIQEVDSEKFPLLSGLSTTEYLPVISEWMPYLMRELDFLIDQVQDIRSLEHLKKIKELAKKCKELEGSFLFITPFELD